MTHFALNTLLQGRFPKSRSVLRPELRTIRNKDGFTLVELMIVVAIIGILASIAVPNYQKFQARARQSEAKISLAGIYTAETSFVVESTTFSMCLSNIGFSLPPSTGVPAPKRYYTVGFNADTTGCGATGGATCLRWDYTSAAPVNCTAVDDVGAPGGIRFLATQVVNNGAVTKPPAFALANTAMTKSNFTAEANGNISSSTTASDDWTITDQNILTNRTQGL